MLEDNIYHPGIVKKITGKTVEVTIVPNTACSGCHAKSFCQLAESEEKVITVSAPAFAVSPGERVEVMMKASLGLRAVLMAYIFPVIFILFVMIAGGVGEWSELWIALAIMAVVILYFFVLYGFRNRLKKRFSFQLRRT